MNGCSVAAPLLVTLMGTIPLAAQDQVRDDTILSKNDVVGQCISRFMAKAERIRQSITECPCTPDDKKERTAELSVATEHGRKKCEDDGEKWCELVAQQAQMDRKSIERQRQIGEQNQQRLSEWAQLNEQAQQQALEDAGKYVLGRYAAQSGNLGPRVEALEERVGVLAKHAASATTKAGRASEVARLDRALSDWNVARQELLRATVAHGVLEAKQAWELSKSTWHHEFRVAAQHDAAIRDILTDPGFREAFAGAADEAPGMEVLAVLEEKAFEEAVQVAVGIEQFEKETGPEIQAAQFVIDEAYDALDSLLSTERVLQEGDLAGRAARAAAVLQSHYQQTIDRLQSCRTN